MTSNEITNVIVTTNLLCHLVKKSFSGCKPDITYYWELDSGIKLKESCDIVFYCDVYFDICTYRVSPLDLYNAHNSINAMDSLNILAKEMYEHFKFMYDNYF